MKMSQRPQRAAKLISLRLCQSLFNDSDSDIELENDGENFVTEQESSGDNDVLQQNADMDEEIDANNLFDINESDPGDEAISDQISESDEMPFTSSSGKEWFHSPQISAASGRAAAANLFNGIPFEVRRGTNPQDEKTSFLLFADDLLDEAVRYTNLYARRFIWDYNRQHNSTKTWKPTDRIEIEGFFGLLIIAGVYRRHYSSTVELWSSRDGHPIFRATMSRERFCLLKRFLRFDDNLRRDRSDPLAPVRNVAYLFASTLKQYVHAPPELTVDEQLLEFHGRVRFRQYIKSKPGKFGIKIYWLCSSDGNFAFNFVIYIGAESLNPEFIESSASHPEAVIMQLVDPFLDNGRNITADNFFSSDRLVQRLWIRKTTFVGTLRSNSRSAPREALSIVNRSRGDTKIFYSENMCLVSYWDKGQKPVLLLDSFNRHCSPPNDPECKPDTVLFYNRTKGGVDLLDKKIRAFTCKRKCSRWPVAMFSNFIDTACINACFILNQAQSDDKKVSHAEFLKNLGYSLVDSCIRRRLQSPCSLQKEVVISLNLCGYDTNRRVDASTLQLSPLQKQKRCQFCRATDDRKSKTVCCKCERVICQGHSARICFECI